jgi:hypothetical protein
MGVGINGVVSSFPQAIRVINAKVGKCRGEGSYFYPAIASNQLPGKTFEGE